LNNRSFILTVLLLVWCFVLLAQKQSQTDTIPKPLDKKRLKIDINSAVSSFQDSLPQIDSLLTGIDSLSQNISLNDTSKVLTDSVISFSKDTLSYPVNYKARDSMIYDIANSKVYLYGNSSLVYDKIDLAAYYVILDWTTNTVTAETDKDSAGNTIDDVVFKDEGTEYKAKKMAYNFTTQKGKVFQVRTKEGDGYMHAEAVKRNSEDEWFGYKAKYTTCDLEHPHFYINARKMKLVPDKVIVSGPANMVIADIPTPFYVPFGIFPVKKDRTTGIIFPQYGDEPNGRGFFLRNGGYYIHFNDYIDLAVTGDIYSNGSYGLSAATNYAKRYKYSGNFGFQYGRNKVGERLDPDFSVVNDFKVNWSHRQDAKARPGTSFGGQVVFGSSTYDRNFSYNQAAATNSSFNSNISYSKTWLNKPLNFSMNASHAQSLASRRVDLTLPSIVFGVSRINPFKPRNAPPKNKWYEQIGFSYNLQFQNQLSGIDSLFLKEETLKNASFGIRQSLPINTTFKVLKYFNVNPAANYNEYWYFKTTAKRFLAEPVFDSEITDSVIGFGKIVSDTTYGFKSARDFDASIGVSTIIYGMMQFKGKVKAIRHVFTPRISFQYQPDFGAPRWGFYRNVPVDTVISEALRYSIFEANGNFPGQPRAGRIGGIGLQLSNILDMKVFSKKDTLKNEKKIKILDNLTISTLYNFAVDSLNLSPISINGRNSFLNGAMAINFNAVFDPYDTDSNFNRVNTYMWQSEKRLTRFSQAAFSLAGSIRPKNTTTVNPTRGSEQEREFVVNNLQGYYDFNIPWSINLNFDLSVNKGTRDNIDSLVFTAATLRFDFDVNVTANWKVNMASGYNFATKLPSYTQLNVIRNLHCWELRFQFVPYPKQFVSYNIQINVKSPVLQELKLSRKQQINNFSQFQ
jgi:hypothetical protein